MKIYKLLVIGVSLLLFGSCKSTKNSEYNICDYGAVCDSITDNANAIQRAINECNNNGGGTVVVPKGVFMTGPFKVASNVELHLDANSELLANPDESIYKESAFGENRGEGMMWISGKDIENFTISGNGKINGNGISFMGKELNDSYELKPVDKFDPRPHVITLINGKNVRIKDVHICNSAYWTLHLVGCNDVNVEGITLLNSLKVRNSDGIDIDHSKNVRISNCYIESGDDCICLKNRREFQEYGVCENIVVTNCTMTSRSCAIKIGSENMDRISHVLFDNCIIRESNRGIGIQNRDEGSVENVVFSNILLDCKFFSDVWWGKSEPIYVTAYRRKKENHKDAGWRFPKGKDDYQAGKIENISFNNIMATSENGIFVGGESEDKINNISFNQVELSILKRTDYKGGIYDRRPCRGEDFIVDKTYGFYMENASNITIRNSSVLWGNNNPGYYASSIHTTNVKALKTENFK